MYDLIIIGGGAASLSAAIYASRYKLNTLVIAKELGGTANYGHKVENYPGLNSLPGIDLMEKFKDHAKHFGTNIIEDEVIDVKKQKNIFEVKTSSEPFTTKSILIATGTERKKLNIPGEEKYLGRGVSYCAICDAAFFKDKIVCVIGGGDSAAKNALLLTQYAKKVYIIYRKEKIKSEPALVEQIKKSKKIEIINNANLIEIKGDKFVKSVIFENKKEFKVDGVFIAIGSEPNPLLIKKLGIKTSKNNYIEVKEDMSTNVVGVYAAGDVTTGSNQLKQIITAASEGVIAANSVYNFLKNKNV